MVNQVPASNAGNARVNLKNVTNAANAQPPTRRAMTGVPGSGKVGTDSRPGSFHGALNEIKSNTPPTQEGILKDTNRKLTGSGRTNRLVGQPLKLDSRGRGPNADGGPRRTDPVAPNDVHGAIIKMLKGSNKPGHADRYGDQIGRRGLK